MKRIVSFATLACLTVPLLSACGSQSSTEPTGNAAASAATQWVHYESQVIEDGHPATIRYWVRGDEVVRQYFQYGTLLYDERCEGKRLSVREMLPSSIDGKPPFNYREVADRDDSKACFGAATHDELRYLRDPKQLPHGEALTLADGRPALRWVGGTGHEFVVDKETSLPVRVDYGSEESGGVTQIAFGRFSITQDAKPPSAPELEWSGFQETFDVPAAEAGVALGLTSVPSEVAGLPLRRSFSFRTQNLPVPSFHLLWGDAERNVQMVTTAANLPVERRGFSSDGLEYDTQEGERHVKVGTIGGDPSMVQSALLVLRPSALNNPAVRDEPSMESGSVAPH